MLEINASGIAAQVTALALAALGHQPIEDEVIMAAIRALKTNIRAIKFKAPKT